MNLPSSSCISLFSSRLFRTGSTFLSAFSTPSTTSTRPNKAALTAGYMESRIAFFVAHTFQRRKEGHRSRKELTTIGESMASNELAFRMQLAVVLCIVRNMCWCFFVCLFVCLFVWAQDQAVSMYLVHIMHSATDNLPPLLEVSLCSVSRQWHILYLLSHQLTKGQSQVSPQRTRRPN